MLQKIEYDRYSAVRYALDWAKRRNPIYYDFENIGGDCTNFVSQCLYAGCGVMNYADQNGWYYIDLNDRAPSWTGVAFLREFLLTNKGVGVYGIEASLENLSLGDVIQLRDESGRFYHSLLISMIREPVNPENIDVCAHSFDARNRRLSTYDHRLSKGIHIIGARR
ncbi:MAG: amidase domain-containing protein [Bacteroides sp.]|nr:amidase domain-containing protein [Eubacterium sp.]MCM1417289.1 amidase domain-containing protein [Roseburia sp.]MCM1461091.1 amidase domain-containing protein [Bacteroides sp.]